LSDELLGEALDFFPVASLAHVVQQLILVPRTLNRVADCRKRRGLFKTLPDKQLVARLCDRLVVKGVEQGAANGCTIRRVQAHRLVVKLLELRADLLLLAVG
jgi:hypothetical protein